MNCKTCKSSFAPHELRNELCLGCTAKELERVQKQAAAMREALERFTGAYPFGTNPWLNEAYGMALDALSSDASQGFNSAEKRPKVVCLCGSSKYPFEHLRVAMNETLSGNIVIPMGLYGHADFPSGARAATCDGDEATEVKQMLDRLHKRKIDLADEIVVVTVDGYYGNSTRGEIEYAKSMGKSVRLFDFPTSPGQDFVPKADVKPLVEALRKAENAIQHSAGINDQTRLGWALKDVDAALAHAKSKGLV